MRANSQVPDFLHEEPKKNHALKKNLSRAHLFWWGRVAVTVILASYLIWRVHDQLASVRFHVAKPSMFGFAIVVAIFGVLISTLLWQIFIPHNYKIPFRQLLAHYLIGMLMNNFLPGGFGGDAVRAIALRGNSGRTDVAINSVLMSRLASLWSIVLMAVVAAVLYVVFLGVNLAIPLVIISGNALLVATGGTIVMFGAPMAVLLKRFPVRWSNWHARLREYLYQPLRLLIALGFAILVQICAICINLFVIQALDLPISAWHLWLSLPLITLISMLPISLGGLGLRESAYVILLGLFGVLEVYALILSLVVYGLLVVVTAVGASVFLLLAPPGLRLSGDQRKIKDQANGVGRAQQALKSAAWAGKYLIKPPLTPTDLLFFVTDRCNARCGHCFYRYAIDVSDGNDHLGLSQVEKIGRSLKEPLHSLVLTGGEPFLRHDLVDICDMFNSICKPDLIVIPTNGLLTGYIANQVERISSLGVYHLLIQISLDGLSSTHDAIRGQDDCFDHAVATARALQGMQKRIRNLEVAILTTISSRNVDELEELEVFVRETLRLPHSFEVVRGSKVPQLSSLPQDLTSLANPTDPGSHPFSPNELAELYPRLERIYRRNTHMVTGGHALWTPIAFAYRTGRYQHLLDVISNQRPFRCPAGGQTGVIYPNGDVALCELSQPVGKLENFNYDFYALWTSEEAQKMRTYTQRCFCTHGCFQTVAMMREPLMVGQIMFSAMRYFFRGLKSGYESSCGDCTES